MYTSLRGEDGVFGPVTNLGCRVNGAADEASPMPFRDGKNGRILYFSSVRPGGFAADAPGAVIGDSGLYSITRDGTLYGPSVLVEGANNASEDGHPNVRRDGLELFFFSNRPGTLGAADTHGTGRRCTSDRLGPVEKAPPTTR